MNASGDAAEHIVRLSLEGMEVTVKLTGTAAKHIAIILFSILKQEQKARGKARLTNMIKSGKELQVFTVPQRELKRFVQYAKQYGVLYCVIKDKDNTAPDAIVDVIARAEDAAKIQRIFDRFEIGKVKTVSPNEDDVTSTEHPGSTDIEEKEQEGPFGEQTDKMGKTNETNNADKTDKILQLGKSLENEDMPNSKKLSVKEKLTKYKSNNQQMKYLRNEHSKEVVSHEK